MYSKTHVYPNYQTQYQVLIITYPRSRVFRRAWLGWVPCSLLPISDQSEPTKKKIAVGKSGPKCHFQPDFSWAGLALGWGVRRFHTSIYMFSNLTELGQQQNTVLSMAMDCVCMCPFCVCVQMPTDFVCKAIGCARSCLGVHLFLCVLVEGHWLCVCRSLLSVRDFDVCPCFRGVHVSIVFVCGDLHRFFLCMAVRVHVFCLHRFCLFT